MQDEFLWSSLEQSSPFGNDNEADAIREFFEWRQKNKEEGANKSVTHLIIDWNYKTYNYKQLDTVKIKEFIRSGRFGDRLYMEIDDVIKATGFGQINLEERIGNEIRAMTLINLNRQLLPVSFSLLDNAF